MAYTVTFPVTGRCPPIEDVGAWVTERGEPFDQEGPHTLQLRALPVRIVVNPDADQFQAHVDITASAPLARLVDLLFALSNRAGTDVRLAGVGPVGRPALWLRLADEQDRRRIAKAVALADEQGRKDEVVRGLWSVIQAAAPGRDIRWDAGRERIVELKEVGGADGISMEEAAWHVEDPGPGDVVALRVDGHPHVVAWRWLSQAHPRLTEFDNR